MTDTTAAAELPHPYTYAEIAGAVARGWCHIKNATKVMDADLALAIADEVRDLILAAACAQPTATSPVPDIAPLKWRHPHVAGCNAWMRNIGYPGCICRVVNKNETAALPDAGRAGELPCQAIKGHEALLALVHAAVERALDEASVRPEVLRGMCFEVALETVPTDAALAAQPVDAGAVQPPLQSMVERSDKYAIFSRDLRDFLLHVIDRCNGEHEWDVVRMNAKALLRRNAFAASERAAPAPAIEQAAGGGAALRECGHAIGSTRWCPDCELLEMRK